MDYYLYRKYHLKSRGRNPSSETEESLNNYSPQTGPLRFSERASLPIAMGSGSISWGLSSRKQALGSWILVAGDISQPSCLPQSPTVY